MIDAALPYLRCPVCAGTLTRPDARALRCPRGHSFDIAKQGYASLTAGRTPHSGDSADMVAARDAFLTAGHYAFIADALTTAARQLSPDPDVSPGPGDASGPGSFVIDAGTGTGHYLARVLDARPDAAGLGLDVSKPALRRSASVILNVFAPRNGREFRRVLRPDGALLVVTPAAGHLRELIAAAGLIHVDPGKQERLTASLGAHFTAERTTAVEQRLRLTGDEIRTLVGMTPSARHLRVDELPPDDRAVTAAVEITVYRPAR
jgi:23S rRNA (guanine745-N1)-methyltransferase